jgi:hypothetical protein
MTVETTNEHKVTEKHQGRDFYDWLRVAVPIGITFAIGVVCGMVTAVIFVVD